MKAVYFPGCRRAELRETPEPSPGSDEVVLEIRASGMCGSDLHTYRSEAGSPFIIGHEPCAVVVARRAHAQTRRSRRLSILGCMRKGAPKSFGHAAIS